MNLILDFEERNSHLPVRPDDVLGVLWDAHRFIDETLSHYDTSAKWELSHGHWVEVDQNIPCRWDGERGDPEENNVVCTSCRDLKNLEEAIKFVSAVFTKEA